MKHRSKQLLSILLSLALVLGLLPGMPLTASAAVGDVLSEDEYLTFTAEEAGSTVTLNVASGSNFQYDLNGAGLTDYTAGTQITLANVGDYVRFRGKDTKFNWGNHVSLTGKVACSGNIMSLRLDDDGKVQGLTDYCFDSMFSDCTGLTSAPELPETNLAGYCYYYMFENCTNLTKAPELPATNLADSCYENMFFGCTSLTELPALPATTLANSCYGNMFNGCTSLTAAPALPATTLKPNCYVYMFSGCSNIYISDEAGTFNGITYSVEYRIPTTGEGTSASYALYGMFEGTGGKFTGTPNINTTYYVPAPAPETFKVYVKKLTGETYTIENLTGETTVAQLKEIIADQIDIPATAQRLIFAGKQLEDAKTLAEYNIVEESTIHLVIRGYTVTWLNYDNSELGTTTVQYGATPSYDGETPTRAEDADYTYTFSGWNDGTTTYGPTDTLPAVTGEVTYTAVFDATPKVPVGVSTFYLVGSFNSWQADEAYALTKNAEAEGEYMLFGVELHKDDALKVLETNSSIPNFEPVWYPGGYNNDYVVPADGIYDIYFRPNYDGGEDWFYNCIYLADVTPELPAFTGKNLSLNGSIGVNFFFTVPDGYDMTGVSFDLAWGEAPHAHTLTVAFSENLWDANRGMYRVTANVAAAEMTDTVTVTMKQGEEVLETDTGSVLTYAQGILNGEKDEYLLNNGFNQERLAKLKDLCQAMLVYGAKSQLQFNYKTENLAADEAMIAELEPLNADEIEALGTMGFPEDFTENCGISYYGCSLLLRSTTTLRLYFTVADQDKLDALTVTLDGNDLVYHKNGRLVYFDVADIPAARIFADRTLNFGDEAVTVNVGAYVRSVLNGSNETLKAAMTALYRYSEAAQAYFVN